MPRPAAGHRTVQRREGAAAADAPLPQRTGSPSPSSALATSRNTATRTGTSTVPAAWDHPAPLDVGQHAGRVRHHDRDAPRRRGDEVARGPARSARSPWPRWTRGSEVVAWQRSMPVSGAGPGM